MAACPTCFYQLPGTPVTTCPTCLSPLVVVEEDPEPAVADFTSVRCHHCGTRLFGCKDAVVECKSCRALNTLPETHWSVRLLNRLGQFYESLQHDVTSAQEPRPVVNLCYCPKCRRNVPETPTSLCECGTPLLLPRPEPPTATPTVPPLTSPGSPLETYWKNLLLFGIAAILFIAAVVLNNRLDERELKESKVNTAVGNLRGRLTGQYEFKEVKKEDRTPVYALAGIGAMFVLAGIVVPGSRSPRL